jgi:hypothetical protein
MGMNKSRGLQVKAHIHPFTSACSTADVLRGKEPRDLRVTMTPSIPMLLHINSHPSFKSAWRS